MNTCEEALFSITVVIHFVCWCRLTSTSVSLLVGTVDVVLTNEKGLLIKNYRSAPTSVGYYLVVFNWINERPRVPELSLHLQLNQLLVEQRVMQFAI